MFAKITGIGMHAPSKVVPNSYFDDFYGRDISTFLVEKRNIRERRWMEANEATSDLILPAALAALKQAGKTVEDVSLIIVSTDTPDYLSPSTAAVVQHKLGAKNAATFDINSACAGFVIASDIARRYIATEPEVYKTVLVVGAYAMSKWLNMDDYKISSLFADGAGAAVLEPTENRDEAILASTLFSDGQYHDYMGVYGGGSFRPTTHEVIEKKQHLLDFAKKIPIETNGTQWPRLTNLLLDKLKLNKESINHFFLTQINIGSIHEALDNLGLPRSLSHNIMDRYGYTGSACLPMAMADAAKSHKLKKGDLVFILGSGGGLSMAAMALKWSYDT